MTHAEFKQFCASHSEIVGDSIQYAVNYYIDSRRVPKTIVDFKSKIIDFYYSEKYGRLRIKKLDAELITELYNKLK